MIEDTAIGGRAGTSSRIENCMGFPTGISGADLCWRGEAQALKFGTHFVMPARVTGLVPRPGGFTLTLDDGAQIRARAVVVATGVQYRRLDLPRLGAFVGAGISDAATEVEARWCRGTEAVVIGGGNSAVQAAMVLGRAASHVHVLVRGASLAAGMSSYLIERLTHDLALTIRYGAEMAGIEGDGRLEAITVRNRATGRSRGSPPGRSLSWSGRRRIPAGSRGTACSTGPGSC